MRLLRRLDLLPLPGTAWSHLRYDLLPPFSSLLRRLTPFLMSILGELDVLFANRVSARKFEKTEADQFAGHGGTVIEKTE